MALSTISRLGEITVAGTADHTLKVTNVLSTRFKLLIKVVSGTVQFELNTVVVAGSPSYTANDVFEIELDRADVFHFKGAVGSEVLNISTSI
jgi:hypothetical protein